MTRGNGIDLEKNRNKKAKTSDDDDNLLQAFRSIRQMFTNNQDYGIVLKYQIHYAEGLDNPNTYPLVTNRTYSVLSWVEPKHEKLLTDTRLGQPIPVWNREFYVTLDRFWDIMFLHVEVLRHGSWSEPGPSNGIVCVGRARIPLPEKLYDYLKMGRFGLVRLVGEELRGEGHIVVSMKLIKYRSLRY